MADAVPSTLHQKVKFMVEESLIIMAVEEDMIAVTTTTAPTSKSKKILLNALFDPFR